MGEMDDDDQARGGSGERVDRRRRQDQDWPRVSLVVSTLGARDNIPRMVDRLRGSDYAGDIEVVVVDQSLDRHVISASRDLGDDRITMRFSTSGLGVSTGRNEGLRHATGEVIGFPDDDTWLEETCLTRVVTALRGRPELGGVSGRQVKADGSDSMLRWARESCDVTSTNWPRTTIASTMFLTRQALDRVGNFDEAIGSGSKGWIGAGEETDLILRVIGAGLPVVYDPLVLVYQVDPRDNMTDAFVAKMGRYGAGMGHLFRRHRLPAWLFLWIAGRKLVGGGMHHVLNQELARDAQLAFVRGMIAGVRRRPPQSTRRGR